VGSILRSALGTQQIPPNQVVTGLAMILTIYVMAPVGKDIYDRVKGLMDKTTEQGIFSNASADILKEALEQGKAPYLDFLSRHAHAKDKQLFVGMAKALRKGEDRDKVTERDVIILVAAFVTSELKEAFQIGFILFVPFLVIDMVVSNVLLAMGMQMLSPQTISLPLKLLLFVLVDGWHLIMKGLVLGYV
jgi:type III secretion protein R